MRGGKYIRKQKSESDGPPKHLDRKTTQPMGGQQAQKKKVMAKYHTLSEDIRGEIWLGHLNKQDTTEMEKQYMGSTTKKTRRKEVQAT